jgi:hypothetical protein
MYLKYLPLRFYPLCSLQFFTRHAAVLAEEVGGFFSVRSELVIILSIQPPVQIGLGSKLH